MAGEQLDLLLKFVLTPGIYTYARSEVCASVVQIAYHYPERKQEITNWFMELFTSLAGMKKEDNIIDCDFSGLAVCDAMELLEPALLPHIKALFERGYVNKGVSGSYEAVEKDLMNHRVSKDKRDLLNIFDRYQEIVSTWAGYTEEEELQPGKEVQEVLPFKNLNLN